MHDLKSTNRIKSPFVASKLKLHFRILQFLIKKPVIYGTKGPR